MRNISVPRIKSAEFAIDATTLVVGDNQLYGGEIPEDALIIGAYLGNKDDALASDGSATTAVKVGSTTVLSATALASIKGTKIGAIDTTPNMASGSTVYLTQAVDVYTAGDLIAGVLYL